MTGPAPPVPIDRGLAAVVVIVPLLLLRDAIFGGAVLYDRDVHLIWHGQIEGFVRAVAAGAWPTWDPWIGFGQPMLANANTQVYYPPTWLNLVMRPWTYYTLYVAAHLAWAGVGMFFLTRALGASRPGARVAAAVWMASGPLLSLASMWNHMAGAAWMPWVVTAALRVAGGPGSGRAAVLGLALAGQFLAGSPDMSAYTGVAVAAVLVSALAGARRDKRVVGALLLAGGLALVVAAAVTAAQWMPTLAAARGSRRWALPDDTRLFWSVHPLAALEMLWPELWPRSLVSEQGRAVLSDAREPFLRSFYLGLPAGGLVLAAFAARRRAVVLIAALGVGAVLAALGRHTPVYGALVTVVPVLGLSRFPVKALPLAAMAWAALAGIGWDVWRDEARASFRRVAEVLAVLVTAGFVLSVFGARLIPWILAGPPPLSRSIVAGAPAIVAVVLALARAARPAHARVLAAAAAAVAAAELVSVHRNLNDMAPDAFYRHRPEVLNVIPASGRVYVRVPESFAEAVREGGGNLARLPSGWDHRSAEGLGHQMSLAPVSAARWGMRGSFATDYMNLQPPYLAQLGEMIRLTHGTPAFARLLRIAGVTHVVTREPGPPGGLVPVAEIEGLLAAPVRVFAVPSPRPRISLVGSARRQETPLDILAPEFDPTREVLLPEGAPRQAPAAFTGVVEGVRERPDALQAEVALSDPGFLVVLDSFDPAWEAHVDGSRVPVLRADNAFRAVAVPAGRHRVDLVYRPKPVRVGFALSLASALVLGAAAALRRRRIAR